MKPYGTGMVLVCVSLCCGCLNSRNTDLLEARLRNREDVIDQLGAQLQSTESDLRVARREANALRMQLTDRGDRPLLPEQADTLFRTAAIRINHLLTGGLDQDQTPGDEAINIVVQPIDQDGDVVKVSGSLELRLLDLSRPEGSQTIGSWQYDANTLTRHSYWHNGFVGKGYQFHLTWQTIPKSDTLLLHARLNTGDGRQFDTSHTVRISLPNSQATRGARRGELDDVSFRPAGLGRIPVDEAPFRLPKNESSNAKPIQTSDRWTDATIPRLR